MNVLVLGANGQLGQAIRAVSIASKNFFIFSDVNSLDGLFTQRLDATDLASLRSLSKKEHIDVFVNCSGYTNVERAEIEVDIARKLNKDTVKNISIVAKELDATVIHISTDYVYDGNKTSPYKETDVKNPLNVYGLTKYEGELELINSGCKYMLLRTSWMFSIYGQNFMKTMIRLTSERDHLNVVYDQVGTPTYAIDLAGFILSVIDNDQIHLTGEYNFTNEGTVSWYDFAVAINRTYANHCEICPISTEEYGSKVKRPSFSALDNSKVKKTFGVKIPDWLESLDKSIKAYKVKEF